MMQTFATRSDQTERDDLPNRRIRVFARRYGQQALRLAGYVAFPLTLTSDLLYCLRENFVPEYPWYSVADLLLSGLCNTVGYDLYEMEGTTRRVLLQRLKQEDGETAINNLQNFMVEYIQHRLQLDKTGRPRIFGDHPHWTALACLKPGEAFQRIQQDLQKLAQLGDRNERFRMAALVDSYHNLLADYRPFILQWAEDTAQGQPINDVAAFIAALPANFPPLQTFEFDVATISFADKSTEDDPDQLRPFTFETVTVDKRGRIARREQREAFYFIEPLPAPSPSLEMVAIPGGRFEMGSPPKERDRGNDEGPVHTVTVPPFFVGRYPVTQAQWRAIASLEPVNRELDLNPARFQGDDRPVERVSWYGAVEFCDRLSRYTGREYRLPSEAEWEYACRAGTTSLFHFGETITTNLANYNGNYRYGEGPKGTDQGETTPVGSFGVANDFGLSDMHGNVWEWCLDHWHGNYEGAPTDGRAWLSDEEEAYRLLRGGSWDLDPRSCRSAYRFRDHPGLRDGYIGFRVVCSAARTQG